ncbi:tRNA pseudouridine synthase B [Bienertia sinuspersici]
MNSKVEFPVFTETNLGTRIAMTVSPEITAGIFKGELERAHVGCFPELGLLSVDAVTVKWNSYFYHLSDLLPLKHVFQGFKGIWLLHVNATLSNKLSDINNNSTQVCKKKRKKKRRKKKPKVKNLPEFEQLEQKSLEPRGNVSSVFEREGNIQHETLHSSKESDFNATAESPCGSFVSVSSIIDRYFTNFIDVDHNGSTSSSEVTREMHHLMRRNFPLVKRVPRSKHARGCCPLFYRKSRILLLLKTNIKDPRLVNV